MSEPTFGPDQRFFEDLADLQRRVRALETGTPAETTSVRDGRWRALDTNGNSRVIVGKLDDAKFGIEVRDAAQYRRIKVTADGFEYPAFNGAIQDNAGYATVTSATFTARHWLVFGEVLGTGVELMTVVNTDPGTTAEIRARNNKSTPDYTQTISIGAGTSYSHSIRWLHQVPLGSTRTVFLLEARRTSGAGNVYVYPMAGWVCDPAGCSTSGVVVT